MNIGEAAAATRKYSVYHAPGEYYWIVSSAPSVSQMRDFGIKAALTSEREAQSACDRLNLLAVLACIREGSDAMCAAGSQDHKDAWGPDAPIFEHSVYRAMIDALIAEVKAQK